MTNTDGTLAPIMGIAILYVAADNVTVIASNTTGGAAANASATATSGAEGRVGGGSAMMLLVSVGVVLMGAVVGL
jgi:fructose-specific phosphotransferase system IIC component